MFNPIKYAMSAGEALIYKLQHPSIVSKIKGTSILFSFAGMAGLMGYALGGTLGMASAILFQAAISLTMAWFSKEIVTWLYSAKKIEIDELVYGLDLNKLIHDLIKEHKLPFTTMPTVHIVDSMSLNAFATGRSRNHAAISFTKGTLLQMLHKSKESGYAPRRLIKAIALHELGHVLNYDIALKSAVSTLAVVLTDASIKISNLLQEDKIVIKRKLSDKEKQKAESESSSNEEQAPKKVRNQRVVPKFILRIMFYYTIPFAIKLLSAVFSRSRETLADENAAEYGMALELAEALKLLKDRKYKADNPESEELGDLLKKFDDFIEKEQMMPSVMCVCHANNSESEARSSGGFFSRIYGMYTANNQLLSTHPPIDERVKHLQEVDKHYSAKLAL